MNNKNIISTKFDLNWSATFSYSLLKLKPGWLLLASFPSIIQCMKVGVEPIRVKHLPITKT